MLLGLSWAFLQLLSNEIAKNLKIFMKHVVHLVYSHIPLVPFIQRKDRSSHCLETIPTSVDWLHIGRVPRNSLLLHIGLIGGAICTNQLAILTTKYRGMETLDNIPCKWGYPCLGTYIVQKTAKFTSVPRYLCNCTD